MTLSKVTLSIITPKIMKLSITMLSIPILSAKRPFNDTQPDTLSVSVTITQKGSAECRNLAIMLSVTLPIVIAQ